jgi:hypothetical protein
MSRELIARKTRHIFPSPCPALSASQAEIREKPMLALSSFVTFLPFDMILQEMALFCCLPFLDNTCIIIHEYYHS